MRPSVVQLHKVNTLEKVLVNRQLGILQPNEWQQVRQRIQEIWSSI